jgi:hypothetical protein
MAIMLPAVATGIIHRKPPFMAYIPCHWCCRSNDGFWPVCDTGE